MTRGASGGFASEEKRGAAVAKVAAEERWPQPRALCASTRKRYAVAVVRRCTVCVVALPTKTVIHLPCDARRRRSRYRSIGSPPWWGGTHDSVSASVVAFTNNGGAGLGAAPPPALSTQCSSS